MLGFLKNNVKLFKKSIKDIFIFEIIYKILFIIIVFPISAILIKFTLQMSGYKYLTNDVLFTYLKSPITIISFILILILNLTYLTLEYYIVSIIMQLKRTETSITKKEFLKLTSNLILNTFRAKNIGFIFLSILYGIITNIMVWFSLSTATKIPDEITRYLNRQPVFIVLIITFISILYLVGFLFIFSIQFYSLNGSNLSSCLKYSIKLIKNRYFRLLGIYLLWNICILMVVVLTYLVAILLIIAILNIIKVDSSIQMAIFLGIFKYINYVVLILGSIFSVSMNFAFITNLYNRYLLNNFNNEFKRTSKPEDFTKGKKVIMSISISIVVCLSIVTSYFVLSDASLQYWVGLKTPNITSHRGSSYYAPENTMLAMEYAVRDLSDYVEIDVQQTKDGEIVVIHDTSLKRTTGVNKNVYQVTYDEIKDLDAGKWFDKNLQDARIPTLSEVLEYCKGKIKLNIEIKGYQHSKNLEEKVVEIVESYDMVDDCCFSSFNYNSLKKIKQCNKDMKTGYIISSGYGDFSKMKYADFFSIRATAVTSNMIKEIHSSKKQVHVWTVNSATQMRNLMQMGVDNIITDNPILANEVINSNHSSTTLLEILDLIFE